MGSIADCAGLDHDRASFMAEQGRMSHGVVEGFGSGSSFKRIALGDSEKAFNRKGR